MAAQAINGRTGGKATKARKAVAAALLAVSFAAIMVHGRASRPVQPQLVKIGETITAVDRPTRV